MCVCVCGVVARTDDIIALHVDFNGRETSISFLICNHYYHQECVLALLVPLDYTVAVVNHYDVVVVAVAVAVVVVVVVVVVC